jgi:hypothetical protein
MRIRSLLLAVLSCGPIAAPALAQEAIESLFSKTEAVTISAGYGCVRSSNVTSEHGDCGVFDVKLEALINLATQDSVHPWGVELALGYGQTTGFRSSNPELDLRGAIRSLPSVAAYASRAAPLPFGFDEVYVGVHSGFLAMHNMRAYDSEGRQYALDGETFEFGVSVGLFNEVGFFVEPSYRIRYFPSVDWQLPDGVDAVPEGWPRSLNLSGPSIAVGYQFSIGGRDDDDKDEGS